MSLLFSLGAFASSASSAKPGMVLLTPTSIAHSGTSASIGANGQVTFTAVTSLSLNGVFSATYDNYQIVIGCSGGASDMAIQIRMRASGTDNSTASSYTRQLVYADNTSVVASRLTSDIGNAYAHVSSTSRNMSVGNIYGPFLAQPTAIRTVICSGYLSAYLQDTAITHNQSTSYDGFSLITSGSNVTGTVQVYGIRG